MIETSCTPEQLQELLSRMARAWEHMGEREPYHSVLTSDLYLKANFDENADGFWGSGEADGAKLLYALLSNGFSLEEFETCLDYGCGVGRCTRFLSRFWPVIACDQSEAHLRTAISNCPPSGRIWYRHVRPPDPIQEIPPGYDILFSILTLQHNPPPVVAYLLDGLLYRMQPGGAAFFHLPTIMPGYSFNTAEYLANPESGLIMEMHCVPQRVIFRIAHEHGCVPIEVRDTEAEGGTHTSTLFLLRKKL